MQPPVDEELVEERAEDAVGPPALGEDVVERLAVDEVARGVVVEKPNQQLQHPSMPKWMLTMRRLHLLQQTPLQLQDNLQQQQQGNRPSPMLIPLMHSLNEVYAANTALACRHMLSKRGIIDDTD